MLRGTLNKEMILLKTVIIILKNLTKHFFLIIKGKIYQVTVSTLQKHQVDPCCSLLIVQTGCTALELEYSVTRCKFIFDLLLPVYKINQREVVYLSFFFFLNILTANHELTRNKNCQPLCRLRVILCLAYSDIFLSAGAKKFIHSETSSVKTMVRLQLKL